MGSSVRPDRNPTRLDPSVIGRLRPWQAVPLQVMAGRPDQRNAVIESVLKQRAQIVRSAPLNTRTSPQPGNPSGVGQPVPAPARRRRIRVTLNGFTCHHETWDHALDADGKRDEIRITADVRLLDGGGNLLAASTPQTRVHGDRNGFPQRTLAGSASDRGGIRTGDSYPTHQPWRRESNRSHPDQLPMTLLEYDLAAGTSQYGVVILPQVVEVDGGGDLFTEWGRYIAQHGGAIAGAVVGLFNPGLGAAVGTGLTAALPAAYSLTSGMLGRAGDRPVGMTAAGDDRFEYRPHAVALSAEGLLATTATDFGKGPGVIELNFVDDPRLAGNYSVYLQFEVIEWDEGGPPP